MLIHPVGNENAGPTDHFTPQSVPRLAPHCRELDREPQEEA